MIAIILTETLTCFKNLYFKYTSLILISQIAWRFVITWLILAQIWMNLKSYSSITNY